MKLTQISPFVKLIVGLLVIALLTGCAYNGVLGVAFTVVDAREWAGAVLNMAMEGQTRQATDYYFLQKQYADAEEEAIPKWAQQELADYEAALNPETTNFRYAVYSGEEQIFGNYDGDVTIATSYDWEERYVGTDLDRQRLEAYKNDWAYDYVNDVALQGVGSRIYPVLEAHKMPEQYKYYDAYGNYYNANGNVIAYNGNYYDENGKFIHNVELFEEPSDNYPEITEDGISTIVINGQSFHIFDRTTTSYPNEFAYYDDAANIYDVNLNFLTTMDNYVSGAYQPRPNTQAVVVTPTPKPVAATPTPAPTPKPQLVELQPLTNEERDAIRDACYEEYVIRGYILEDMAVEDGYSALYDEVMAYADHRESYLQNAVGLGIGGLILLAFLMLMAGKRGEKGEYEASGTGRLPWDVWLVGFCCLALGAGCVVFVAAQVVSEALYYRGLEVNVEFLDLGIKGCIAAVALCVGLLVGAMHSVAARVKVKGWWRNFLCGRLCVWAWGLCVKCLKWLWRLWKRFWDGCKRLLAGIPLIWKAVVVLGGSILIETLFCWDSGAVVVAVLWNVLKFLVLMIICLMLKRLQQGARTIADGDLEHRIDTKNLYFDLKEHAECLNRIGEGLSHNVDARLRSERMKTELITNVSHDLKTPLTSIVNYVDLLKKENLTGAAAEYVEVLDRQSARLKKLTEDLVEASKASTGALNVSVERVSLTELLEQAQAEYDFRLASNGLQVIARQPEGDVAVWADGKYVWRILDNLLSNVCKYAMPNSRVYLELRTEGESAVLSVKNMSRESLNISAEELMERFVRGDESRNTEGSGLGLSIAQSLAKLMGGEVRITVDGDLFKADVVLPMAK